MAHEYSKNNIKYALTYLGLLPFFFLSSYIIIFPNPIIINSYAISLFKSYGMIIAIFLSGCHWGQQLSMTGITAFNLAIISNALTIFTWLSYSFLPDKYFLLLLVSVFSLLLLIDKYLFSKSIINKNYFKTRFYVTICVNLMLLIIMVRVW